ncbi:hypothetical protein NFC73_19570 [Pseudarthrobacter sp. RMG13]|uniref:Uncharacterized protein n=1 Tax=Pseudarthrobacter humi TaxID=2952523 RepID=A0ABT1LUT2_9MICC|nr:hypothetical protein [Pseudarthrobacter humi]MCP9001909.1 hypothetical protein [Pseudarthrobacter humi]
MSLPVSADRLVEKLCEGWIRQLKAGGEFGEIAGNINHCQLPVGHRILVGESLCSYLRGVRRLPLLPEEADEEQLLSVLVHLNHARAGSMGTGAD